MSRPLRLLFQLTGILIVLFSLVCAFGGLSRELLSLFALIGVAVGAMLFAAPLLSRPNHNNPLTKRSRRAEYSLNHGTELVIWISRANTILDVNEQLLKVLGYQRPELTGQSPLIIDRGWIAAGMPEIWSRTAMGEAVVQETIFRDSQGRHIPFEVLIKQFRDSDDTYLCVFAHDITEKRRVSLELQGAKELFEMYLQGLPIGAFVRNQQGQFLYVNDQFSKWNPGIEAGKFLRDAYVPEVAEQFMAEDRQVLDEGAQIFFQDNKLIDQGRSFEIHKFPLRLPSQPSLIGGIVTETTARRRTEVKLQESKAFLEAVIDQSPVGIIILDAVTTNILICNDVAKDMLGHPRNDDLAGKTISHDGLIWEVLNPDGTLPSLEQNPLYKAFFQQSSANDRMVLRRPDGQERFVMINSGPIYDAKDQFIAAIVAFLDITELSEVQDRLEELNYGLEQMVESRTRELSQSNQALKVTIDNLRVTQDQLIESEKMASLGGLVAGVAHEINTPVGVGVTAASFLHDATQTLAVRVAEQTLKKSDLDNYVTQALQSSTIILSNLERASNLIKSFKMISVDQSTDLERRFKVKDYLHELFVSLHAPDKRLRLAIELDGDPNLEIVSYPGTFSQIITNLFMNSCVHGFQGKAEGLISLGFVCDGGRLELRYRDNGHGMNEATLRRIYEPFFTTRRDHGGTGLGMNIVFNLVTQKLGGTIRSWSLPGEGTEFVLDIPVGAA